MTNPTVVGLQIAKASRLPMIEVDSIEIIEGVGITGDRYEGTKHRHVTVQSLEEIALAEQEVGRSLNAVLTRRNVTVSHGTLDRSPGTKVRLGEVLLEVVRDAAPCKLLEDTLGRDSKLALHKRAGVVYRAIGSGVVVVGDELSAA